MSLWPWCCPFFSPGGPFGPGLVAPVAPVVMVIGDPGGPFGCGGSCEKGMPWPSAVLELQVSSTLSLAAAPQSGLNKVESRDVGHDI